MRYYFLFILLCFSCLGFSQNMPSNPKPGECYVRCKDSKGDFLEWKTIDCDLIKPKVLDFENLEKGVLTANDRKTIKKKLIKILKKGYTVELLSHYFSNKPDSINELRSIQNSKALISYLKTQEVNVTQLLISAYGYSKPLENCLDKTNCLDFYNKNTRFEYRVVNAKTTENLVWNYDNEKKIWCYKASK